MSLLDQWEAEAKHSTQETDKGDYRDYRILTLIELVWKKDAYFSILNRETNKVGVEMLNAEWVQSLTSYALALTKGIKK